MDILIKPVNTEKSANLQTLNQYIFIVNKRANKIQIKNAVEKIYDVKVVNVNTIITRGKRIERYTKKGLVSGKKVTRKKAMVTLSEGDKIDIFNN